MSLKVPNGNVIATKFARFVGSWRFLIIQNLVIAFWIAWNSSNLTAGYHWDYSGFLILNLIMSWQAANATPVILMAQNVQDEEDRILVRQSLAIHKKTEAEVHMVLEEVKGLHEEDLRTD